jgi:hypothetical protein
MLNRRRFMTGAVASITVAGLAAGPEAIARQVVTDALPRFDRAFSRKTFEALENEVFRIRDGLGQIFDVRLIAVRDAGYDRELEQFSVVFAGPPAIRLPEASYTVEHRRAGRCHLHLCPGAQDGHRQQLSAVFSLLR